MNENMHGLAHPLSKVFLTDAYHGMQEHPQHQL